MAAGCFKKGCVVSAGLVGLVIALSLVILALGFVVGVPEAQQENQILEQPLPELEGADGAAAAENPAASAPDFVERPLMPDAVGTPTAGKVILDLEMGEFAVEPGPAGSFGENLRVEAEYDSASFDLEERYEIQDDGTWTYRLSLQNKVPWFRRLWGGGDVDNKVKLILPRGYPMEVTGNLRAGESRVELGGLWLTKVDLKTSMGDHRVSFQEPLPQPLEWLRLEGGMGEAHFLGLGNAAPASAYIESEMGELRVDLAGAWRQDGVVDVKFKMGECRILVPDNVHLEIDRASISMGERSLRNLDTDEPLPEDAPTVTLRADSSMGELRIEREKRPSD